VDAPASALFNADDEVLTGSLLLKPTRQAPLVCLPDPGDREFPRGVIDLIVVDLTPLVVA